MLKEKLIVVDSLSKHFKLGKHTTLKAVDDVSFDIYKGETLGLVGESGCGKTTCGRTIMGLYQASAGNVTYQGKGVHNVSSKEKLALTKKMQIIFQDPYAALNPRMTVGDIICEGIDIHKMYTGEKRAQRTRQLLDLVGLNREHASRFPHEFSGGQRQRIGIARALAVEPEFIVCDEPISALDVSIQAQVVNLMISLQKELQLTYLFIAHDLSMVKHISDRVGVMYLGNMVELTTSDNLFSSPLHPYTQALLSAIPEPDPIYSRQKAHILLEGEIPSPLDVRSGCSFASRCPKVISQCHVLKPALQPVRNGHFVACHLYHHD